MIVINVAALGKHAGTSSVITCSSHRLLAKHNDGSENTRRLGKKFNKFGYIYRFGVPDGKILPEINFSVFQRFRVCWKV